MKKKVTIAFVITGILAISTMIIFSTYKSSEAYRKAKAKTQWECSVVCAEKSTPDSYVITYSDAKILSNTGVLTVQNRNDFDITVHLLCEGKQELVSDSIPAGGCYSFQNVTDKEYTVGIHAEVDENTDIKAFVYDGKNTEPYLEKLVATIRSREISACLVLQAQSQLKAIYKDNADTIIGNMDSRIFLGGSEPTTLKELNQALGKETIDTYNTSNTRGNSPSYGLNYQKLGKDLASVDELAVLDGSKCILQLRGVRPFLSDKYDLTQHPNYKYTSDFDKRNEFNIEQFLSRRLKLKAGDEFVVVDAD